MERTYASAMRRARRNGRRRDDGMALIIALIAMTILSMLAAGIIFSTQSEIWTTASYRQTVQARYVAEAGAERAAYYLSSTAGGAKVSAALTDLLTNSKWQYNTIPVTYNGSPVIVQSQLATGSPVQSLTDSGGKTNPTYSSTPVTQLIADFQAQLGGDSVSKTPFQNATGKGSFSVAMELLSVQPDTLGWLTKWKIISVGTVDGIRQSHVQVAETVEGVIVPVNAADPLFKYGLYATGTGCNVITMTSSSVPMSSFDSTSGTTTNTHHGNVATRGSINLVGYTIDGSVTTSLSNGISSMVQPPYGGAYIGASAGTAPNYPSSTCGGTGSDGKPAPQFAVYEDNSGTAAVTNSAGNPQTDSSLRNCYQNKNCPTGYNTMTTGASLPTVKEPSIPSVSPTNSACTADVGCNNGANWSGKTVNIGGQNYYDFTLPDNPPSGAGGSYGIVGVGSGTAAIMHLKGGHTYNFDKLTVLGSGKIVVDSPSGCTGSGCGVTINIVGSQNASDVAVYLGGAGTANNNNNPANLLINYNGPGNVVVTAGSAVWGTIDAPNANFFAGVAPYGADMGGWTCGNKPVCTVGSGLLYGAVIAKTAYMGNSGAISFDTNLAKSNGTNSTTNYYPSPFFVSEFSWNAF